MAFGGHRLPYNGGFGHDEVTVPAEFPRTFKNPSPSFVAEPPKPKCSLLRPDYLVKALAGGEKTARDEEYPRDELISVKSEPDGVGFINNQGGVNISDPDLQIQTDEDWKHNRDEYCSGKKLFNNNEGGLHACDADYNLVQLPDSNLYVGNLPVNCSEYDLYNLFSTYGNVVDVRIVKNYDLERQAPGFAFVRFTDPYGAARVLNSEPIKLFGYHRLNVQRQDFRKMKRRDVGDASIGFHYRYSQHDSDPWKWSTGCETSSFRVKSRPGKRRKSWSKRRRGYLTDKGRREQRGNKGGAPAGIASGEHGQLLFQPVFHSAFHGTININFGTGNK